MTKPLNTKEGPKEGEIPSGAPSTAPKAQKAPGAARKAKSGPEMGAAPGGQVLVDAATLERMNTRLEAAEAALAKQNPPAPKRVATHDARVMFVDDMPVIAFSSCVEKKVPGDPRSKELWITVTLLADHESGKTEKREMLYLDLMNDSPRFLADIKSQKVVVEPRNQGVKAQEHTTINPDPAGIGDDAKGFRPRKVILTHEVPVYRSLIEFREGPLSGVEIEVSNDCLNP